MNSFASKKVLVFGALGAVGCLIGWAAGEGLLAAGLPAREGEKAAAPSLASRPIAVKAEAPKLDRPAATAPPKPKAPELAKRDAPKPVAPPPIAPNALNRPAPPPLPPDFQKRLDAAGGKTGEAQLTLLWNNRNDLDLLCIDPNDELIFFGHKKALMGSGAHLDVDRNVADSVLTDEPVENIYFPAGATLGRYKVYVIHWSNNGATDPTEFRLNALAEGKRVELKGKLSDGDKPLVKEDKDRDRAIAAFKRGLEKYELHSFELPGLRVAAPDVTVYPGAANKFRVKVERDKRNTAPVRLTFAGETTGLTLPEVTIAEDRDEAEVEVAAAADAALGARKVRATAAGKYGKVEAEFQVAVQTPPPAVYLSVPPEVVLFPGGRNQFQVSFTRYNHDGPVTVALVGDAPGLTLPAPVEVPGDRSEALLDVSAARTAAAGARPLKVVAKGKHGEVAEGCQVTVQIPPATIQIAAAKSVPVQPGGEATVTVLVARDWYTGPVKVTGTSTNREVMAWEATIPADRDSVELKVSAFAGAKEGTVPLALTAQGGTARAETETTLEIANPPPPPTEPPPPRAAWSWLLVLLIGLWTALLAVGLATALVVGQNRYLGRSWLSGRQLGVILLCGGAAGLVAGAIGQTLFALMARTNVLPEIGFLAGWLLLGGLLGRGLAFFIPNLHPWRAAAAGVVGGLCGAIAFILISRIGDTYGRFVGAALLGGCIGLMVALVELAFRSAWLEVHYSASEVITVNLGPEPVKIGSDNRACTVWARGAAPEALRFWIRDGQVLCEDAVNRTTDEVSDGERRRAGSLEVVVRTGSGEAPARPASKPAARPAPRKKAPDDDDDMLPLPMPSSRPVAKPSNDDDYDSLPMPVSPPPSAVSPKPASRPVLPAVPPRPAAPASGSRPGLPAAPSGSRPALPSSPPSGSKPSLPPVPPKPPGSTTVRSPTPTNPPSQSRAMNIPCPKCKAKLALGSRKCPECGANW